MFFPLPFTNMLYFQLVIMAGTVMLAYYFEYTDTFNVHVQGFFCYDNAYVKPYLGPEESSAIPPILLYALVAGVPTFVMMVSEAVLFLIQDSSKELDGQEKTIQTGDCCYLNPLVQRTCRFLGVYMFGLFTVDIFVNAGQLVTGNLAPHFLTVCKPNYTALGCQHALVYISQQEACTGNQEDVLRARKTFPSKEAALSVYAAFYLASYITCAVEVKGTRLAKPVLCLGLMYLAFLTVLNRVAEYRNHWSDVIAGFIIGVAIATFLFLKHVNDLMHSLYRSAWPHTQLPVTYSATSQVVCVVHNFKGKQLLSGEDPPQENMSRVERPLEKYITLQNHIAFAEVT